MRDSFGYNHFAKCNRYQVGNYRIVVREGSAMMWKRVYDDFVARELSHEAERFPGNDKAVMKELCAELNDTLQPAFHYQYMFEINQFVIPGAGPIVVKYIDRFESEYNRAALVYHIAHDKVKNGDRIIMDMYYHFKNSRTYIPPAGEHGPAAIIVDYDNAFWRMKSKKLVPELVALMRNPRDLHYLPLTATRYLYKFSSEMEEIALYYLKNNPMSRKDVGLPESGTYYPPVEDINRENTFQALTVLSKFPTEANLQVISTFLTDEIYGGHAKKLIEKMKQKMQK